MYYGNRQFKICKKYFKYSLHVLKLPYFDTGRNENISGIKVNAKYSKDPAVGSCHDAISMILKLMPRV